MNATQENLVELLSLEAMLEGRMEELARRLAEVRQQIKEADAEETGEEECPW